MATVDEALAALGGEAPPKTSGADSAKIDAALQALDAEKAAHNEDKSTFSRMLGVAGAGIYKAISDVAGLPGTILDGIFSTTAKSIAIARRLGDFDDPTQPAPLLSPDVTQPALETAARAMPSGKALYEMPSTLYNIGADALGGNKIAPVYPRNRDEKTAFTIGENVGYAAGAGLGLAAGGLSRAGGIATTAAARAEGGRIAAVTTPVDRLLAESGRRATTGTSLLGLATAESGIGAAAGIGQDLGERAAARIEGDDLGSAAARAFLPLGGAITGGGLAGAAGTATRGAARAAASLSPYTTDGTAFAKLTKLLGGQGAEDVAASYLRSKKSGSVGDMMDNFDAYAGEIGNVHSAAQQAADDGILSIERSILTTMMPGHARLRSAALNSAAQKYSKAVMLADNPELSAADAQTQATLWFKKVTEDSTASLDRLVEAHSKRVLDDIATFAPKASRSQISQMATAGLETAYRDARSQENALWQPLKADETVRVPVAEPLKAELARIRAETPKSADPANWPKVVDNLLDGAKKDLRAEKQFEVNDLEQAARDAREAGNFGEATMHIQMLAMAKGELAALDNAAGPVLEQFESIKEVMALYSRLGKLQREAAAGTASTPGNAQLAANYGRLRDTILTQIEKSADDLGGAPLGEQMKAARAYSVALNDRFTRGPVAEIFATNRRGGGQDPRTALESLAGQPGVKGYATLTDLIDAEAFTNTARQKLIERGLVPEGAIGTPIKQLTEGYLADIATQQTVVRNADGTLMIDPAKLEQFKKNYKEQLGHYPNLRANLDNADLQSQVLANLQRDRDQLLKIESETGKNALALWLSKDPDQAMAAVLGNRGQQAQMMRQLVAQAERDPRAEALPALRRLFYDEMMADARIGGTDRDGLRIMTSQKLGQFLEDHAKASEALFTPDQRRRLSLLQREIQLGESTQNAKAFAGDSTTAQSQAVRDAMEGPALGTLIRTAFSGLRVGGALRSVPFMSNLANEADAKLSAKVMDIVGRAVTDTDPSLFKDLMRRPTPENVPIIRARLRSYLAASADGNNDYQGLPRQPLQLTITPNAR